MDYIYVADADEVIDEENRERFKALKKVLLPEVEIVQMKYCNQLEQGSVYNLMKNTVESYIRLRTFQWIDLIHETVNLEPVVFDSDIEIIHKPLESMTAGILQLWKNYRAWRTFFQKTFRYVCKGIIYCGKGRGFSKGGRVLQGVLRKNEVWKNIKQQTVLAKASYLRGDMNAFFMVCLKKRLTIHWQRLHLVRRALQEK